MFRSIAAVATERRTHHHYRHGQRRSDPYHWLTERDDPAVAKHLHAENAYAAGVMADTTELQATLFAEIRGRMADEKKSPAVYERGYWYWYQYAKDADYPTYWRSINEDLSDATLLLDAPALARGSAYFAIGDIDIATDERWLAYTTDTTGRRQYQLHFVDLESGEHIASDITDISAGIAFANDAATLFVVAKDSETLREYRVDRLVVAAGKVTSRTSVYQEDDTAYLVELGRTTRRDFVVLTASTTLTTEHWLIDANQPAASAERFLAREPGHEDSLDFDGTHFWVLSNRGAPNGALHRVRPGAIEPSAWETIVAESTSAQLEDFALFEGFVAIELTDNAQGAIDVLRVSDRTRRRIEFDEAVFAVGLDDNPTFAAGAVRLSFESMTHPATVYDVDLATLARTTVYIEPVPGDFDSSHYTTERIWVERDDGARVPVSLVRRADLALETALDVLVYGYGAYGYSLEPVFSVARPSLLDRGFVFAIAHVRGGSELGQRWYDGGRLRAKHASFDDFNAVAEHLQNYGSGAANRLYAMGGSAGGLLVGAAMNDRPDLYAGVVADVPFVDVVTTMLDETIPLTTFEYEEWGDPRRASDYHTMMAYSPYDNVTRQAYPHVLITAGLHDSQVQYWEPAKWAARLRERNTAATLTLLKTEMEAGHGGQSGRYQSLHERCFAFAFLVAVREAATR